MGMVSDMKEKPIIFNPEMVKAILVGRKTQTRRVMKPQPVNPRFSGKLEHISQLLPYEIGQRLWVRERWRIVGWPGEDSSDWCVEYKDGFSHWIFEADMDEDDTDTYWMQCSDDCIAAGLKTDEDGYYHFDKEHPCPTRWRPSIFMPRWGSRIKLEVVNIRVEQLREISLSDIEAEGTPAYVPEGQGMYRNDGYQRYKDFKYLWNDINKKRGFSWDVNPWVWVIEFKQVETLRIEAKG